MTKNATLHIAGMHCAGCADTVRAVLRAQDGVETADVSLDKGQGQISYHPDAVSIEGLATAVARAGYSVQAGGP